MCLHRNSSVGLEVRQPVASAADFFPLSCLIKIKTGKEGFRASKPKPSFVTSIHAATELRSPLNMGRVGGTDICNLISAIYQNNDND